MVKKELKTYLKLCTEFYDLELRKNPQEIMDFYMNYAQDAKGPILEPMCGTGRFIIPMLKEGLDIEGFDASFFMLEALKQKCIDLKIDAPPIWQQFIEDFDKAKQYNLIFVAFGSWGLITDLENAQRCMKNMYNHLAPGGKLVIEIDTIASVPSGLGIWHRGIHKRSGGSYLALNTFPTYNAQTQNFKTICRYESIINNEIDAMETEDFEMYIYKFDELEDYLKKASFSQIKKFQDFKKTSATNPNAPIVIYECIK